MGYLAGSVLLVWSALLVGDAGQERARELKQFFEGQSVSARVDLPATGGAIDVDAAAPSLDATDTMRRVAIEGAAIRAGEVLAITRVDFENTRVVFRLKGPAREVRLNLRYGAGVPRDITPGSIMAALADRFEFPFKDQVKRRKRST